MPHPEWVLKHKVPNTEVRCIRGRYYLYNRTSVWCPQRKRPKKVTLKQVGVIDKSYGLIPTGMSRKGKVPKGMSKIKETHKLEGGFADRLEKIEDPRSTRNQLHSIVEIMLVILCALLCGAEGWRDVENYGKAKLRFLKKILPFKNGIPSDDTFRRFLRYVNPKYFQEVFQEWVRSLAETIKVKVLAIDGKTSKRSYDEDGKPLHTVSAFATDARIVLGQEKVDEKSNEITAIPKLLELLDVEGYIITIDAMGCQYAIADKIISKKANYVLALKGNQGNFCKEVEARLATFVPRDPMDTSTEYDKGHGRIETRKCTVCKEVQWIKAFYPQWKTVESIIRIDSIRDFGEGKIEAETRYYISSLCAFAAEVLKTVRSHWGIENCLHWILDMSFNEDYSRIRKGNAPQNMAIIRHMALNMLHTYRQQHSDFARQSIKGMRKMCAWDNDIITELLCQN